MSKSATTTLAGLLGAFLGASALGGVLLAGLTVPAAAALGTVTSATDEMLTELPSEVELPAPSEQSVIRWADGSVMARFYAENRIVVPLEEISPHMQHAVVAIEDKRFYEHAGVDPKGITRAFVNNLAGGPLEGASTLTQQYVRNSLVEAGRQSGDPEDIEAATETTAGRKLREISLALALEQRAGKDEILGGYLNIAQFGPSQYGVEAAARHYFSTSAKDLGVVQAATLAGITQSPNRWDPVEHPEDAQRRRDTVLGEMLSQEYISQEEHDAAIATPVAQTLAVQDTANGCAQAGDAAYFCEYAVKDFLNNDGWEMPREERTTLLYRGGLTIDTTLQPHLQAAAHDAVVGAVPVHDPSGVDASIVSVEPGTGHIVAMAQNTDFGATTETDLERTQINMNAGRSHGGGLGFQAGSSFKIFTLVEWLNSGRGLYDRVPQNDRTFRAGSWTIPCAPEMASDYDPSNLHAARGTTTVMRATKLSTNLPFVEMGSRLDLCRIMDDASALGVERGDGKPLEPRPGAILGSNEVTPLSMASAFASLADRGNACPPVAITKVTDPSGAEFATPSRPCAQAIEQTVADQTNVATQQVMTRGGTGSAFALPGRPSAGKTGTANNASDAWFVGYTPQYSTAVWLGHREGTRPMLNLNVNGRYYRTVFGSSIPGPIWNQYMTTAHQGLPAVSFTAGAPAGLDPKDAR